MARITKTQFNQQLQGKSVSLEKVRQDTSLSDTLKRDIQRADLNQDGFISGSSETNALFAQLDEHDRNGSRNSFDTTAGGAATAAGQGYQAALAAIETTTTTSTFADSAQGRFAELLSTNPDLRNNQDLVNLFFRRGNGNWGQAESAAKHYGQDLNALTQRRSTTIDRDAAIRAGSTSTTTPTGPITPADPGTPTGPTTPVNPTGPTAPTGPVTAPGFVTETGRVSGAFGNTRSEREAQAEAILKQMGQWPPQEGRAYAIQIDQDTPPASASATVRSNYLRSYSGQMSAFQFENGRLQEISDRVYRSASHTGQFTSSLSPDVNGGGGGDIAHIRPGVYNYTTNMHRSNGKRRLNPLDNDEFRNSARDLNHNGVIDGREIERNYSATAIQIHEGNSNSPSSIGCQTMPPNDFTQFMSDVREVDTNNKRQFTYILMRRPNDQYGANPF